MPNVITTVHDPVTLIHTCRRIGLPPPIEGWVQLDSIRVWGWIVRLSGLHAPVVFDTLTGLVAYHPRDNAFVPFRRIARLVHRYYDVRAELRRGRGRAARHPEARRPDVGRRRLLPAREVA